MKQILIIAALLCFVTSCHRGEDEPTIPFRPFVLTDSAGIAFQEYLAAGGGHWQFTEAIYTSYSCYIQGGDTICTLADSGQQYLGPGISPENLQFYRFKFSKVVSERDEMAFRFTYYNYWPIDPGADSSELRAWFIYPLRQIEVAHAAYSDDRPFDAESLRVLSMEADHMWLVATTYEFVSNSLLKQYYKLEKRP